MNKETILHLISQNHYDEIIKLNIRENGTFTLDYNTNSSDFDIIYGELVSLIKAGYFFKAIEVIQDFTNGAVTLPSEFYLKTMFLLIEAYNGCQNYAEAKKILNSIKSSIEGELEPSNKCTVELIQSRFIKLPTEFRVVEEKFTQIITNAGNEENQELLAHCLLKRGIFYRVSQQPDKMIVNLEKSKELFTSLNDTYGLGKIYYQMGYSSISLNKLDQSQLYFEKSAEFFKSNGNLNEYAYALAYLAHIYTKKGDLKTAENLLIQSLSISKLFEDDFYELDTKEKLADNYLFSGELDKALDLYNELVNKIGHNNDKELGGILNHIGTIHALQGKFEESLNIHKKALDLFTAIQDVLGEPWSNIYLGESAFRMGDFDGALECWIESYKQFKILENRLGLGFASINIGKTYLVLNDEQSSYYYEQAIAIFEKLQHLEGMVESYIGYAIILEEQKNFEQARIFHAKARAIFNNSDKRNSGIADKLYNYCLLSLENSFSEGQEYVEMILFYLNQNKNSKLNELRIKFLTAVKLYNTERLKEKAKALELFESITKNEIIDYYTTLMSYLYRLEIKIFELRTFDNLKILQEANKILEDITMLTASNNYSSWALRTKALKAQIKLIEFKYDEAKQLLNEAIETAVSKNMKRLAFQLHNQFDDLMNRIHRLKSLKFTRNSSTIAEVLDITDFSIFDENRDKFNMEILQDEPTYLSLINTTGMTLYSYNFNLISSEDFDQLISGFLIAINSVITKLFSSSGFIERIKHKDYTITLYALSENIYICYAYKGPSYHAQTKINQFREELLQHPFMQSIYEASNTKRTLNSSEIVMVEKILTNIFLQKGINNPFTKMVTENKDED